jgi:hypothetical protein
MLRWNKFLLVKLISVFLLVLLYLQNFEKPFIEDVTTKYNMLFHMCLTFYSSYFQKYTAKKMYELSEAFFMTLGFDKMTDTFWEKSMIEKPEDKDVVCHASAEDFYRQEDFR